MRRPQTPPWSAAGAHAAFSSCPRPNRNAPRKRCLRAAHSKALRASRLGFTAHLLALLCLLAAAAFAQGPADDVQITGTPFAGSTGSGGTNFTHGYSATMLRVTNNSPTRRHRVVFQTPSGTLITRRVDLAPGATAQVPWLAPLFPNWGWQLLASVDGVRKESFSYRLPLLREYDLIPVVLLSRHVSFSDLDDKLNPAPAGAAAATGSGAATTTPAFFSGGSLRTPQPQAALNRAEMEVNAWFTNWLFYSAYDAVILTAAELATMPPEAMDAMVRYVECGGTVMTFGTGAWPAGWRQGTPRLIDGFAVRDVGFGRWVQIPVETPPQLTPAHVTRIQVMLHERIQTRRDIAQRLREFPVVDKVTIPIGGMSVCILAFAFLAGPVNLFILIRRNRRVWLLWTTPLLSLLFSVVLVAYFLLGEGLHRRARIQGLTILNEGTKRATTLGVDGFYCPLPPADGVRYAPDWEVTPYIEQDNRGGRGLDLTTVQHFHSGWIQSRVPSSFALRTSRHAAERLPITLRDGKVTVVNGLGAAIRWLHVVTRDGKAYHGANIAAGAEAVLVPGVPPEASAASGTAKLPVPTAGLAYRWVQPLPEKDYAVAPGQYLAVLEKAVFVDKGLARADYRELNVVLGLPAPETSTTTTSE